jgi:O-antigen/teichoic acid export membrane protein
VEYILVFLSRVLSRGAALITLLVLTEALSISDIGYYGLIITTSYSAMYLGSLGIRHASAYFIGKKKASLSLIFSLATFVSITMSAITAIVLYFYYRDVQELFQYGNTSLLAAIIVIPLLITFILQGIFLGVGDFKNFNASEILPKSLMMIAICMLYLLGVQITLDTSLSIFLITALLGSLYVLIVVRRSCTFNKLAFKPFLPMMSYGLPLTLSSFFTISLPLVTMTFLEGLSDGATLGVFYLAYKVTEIFGEAATSVGMVSFSKGVRGGGVREALLGVLPVVWAVMMLALVVLILVMLISLIAFNSFSSEVNKESLMIFVIVISALPFLSFSRVINPALAAQGFAYYGAFTQFLSVIVNSSLAWFLLPYFGFVGVLVALLLARIFSFMALSLALSKILNLTIAQVMFPDKRELFRIVNIIKLSLQKTIRKILN